MIPETQIENVENLIGYLNYAFPLNNKDNFSQVVLIDADRTLTPIDTSSLFNPLVGIDSSQIKANFKKHGYTFKGFYGMSRFYSQIPFDQYLKFSKEVAKEIELYPNVKQFFDNLVEENALTLIVTSGIETLWKELIRVNGIEGVHVIGGVHDRNSNFLIGREEKGVIASYFRDRNSPVIGIGDSDVDTLMLLNSDIVFLVVNHRKNKDILPYLKFKQRLFQIRTSYGSHANIPAYTFDNLTTILKTFKKQQKSKEE